MAYEAEITLFEPYGPYTFEPVTKDAVEAVPKSEPVIPFDTVSEFSEAFEPDTTTLFQFGI